MKTAILSSALIATLAAGAIATPSFAQDYRGQGRGYNQDYRSSCRGAGANGAVIGALAAA